MSHRADAQRKVQEWKQRKMDEEWAKTAIAAAERDAVAGTRALRQSATQLDNRQKVHKYRELKAISAPQKECLQDCHYQARFHLIRLMLACISVLPTITKAIVLEDPAVQCCYMYIYHPRLALPLAYCPCPGQDTKLEASV